MSDDSDGSDGLMFGAVAFGNDAPEALLPPAAPGLALAVASALPAPPPALPPALPGPASASKRRHRATSGLYGSRGRRTAAQKKGLADMLAVARRRVAVERRLHATVALKKRTADIEALASYEASMRAAFTPGTVTSLALYTKLSRRSVLRSIKAAALAYLRLQERLLERIAANVVSHPGVLKRAWERLEYDETRQWMRVDSVMGLLPSQTRSSWNVLAVIHWLGLRFAGGGVHHIPIIRLPVICVGSKGAGVLCDFLEDMPSFAATKQSLKTIMSGASDGCFRVREPDAGGNNLRFSAWEEDQCRADDTQGFDCLPCGLHQQNLLVRRCMSPEVCMNLVKVASSLACLLATGDYFTRLALSITSQDRSIVDQKLRIVRRPPSAKAQLLQQLFLDLFFPKPAIRSSVQHKKHVSDLRSEFEVLLTGVPGFRGFITATLAGRASVLRLKIQRSV